MSTQFRIVSSLELDISAFSKAIKDAVDTLEDGTKVLGDGDNFSYKKWWPGYDDTQDPEAFIAIIFSHDPWADEIAAEMARFADYTVTL